MNLSEASAIGIDHVVRVVASHGSLVDSRDIILDMSRRRKSAVVLVGLSVSVFLALTACTSSVDPIKPPVVSATPSTAGQDYGADGAPGSAQRLEAYDQAAAAFPLPLPDGYVFPADGEALSENGYAVVLEHWIAATADAALRAEAAGDTATADRYVAALAAAWPDPIRTTFGPNVDYIGQAIEERNLPLLLRAFPVQDGMITE